MVEEARVGAMLDDLLEPVPEEATEDSNEAQGNEAPDAPVQRNVSFDTTFDTTTSGTPDTSPQSGRKRQTAEISATTSSNCQYFDLGASAKKRRVGDKSDLCDLYESADWTIGGRRRRVSDERGWVEVPLADEIHSKENVGNQNSGTPDTRGMKKGTNFLHNMTSETRALAKGGRSSPKMKRKMSDALSTAASTASKKLRSWMSPPKF
jgi:hypothetical protein